jgi:hypothetical protein
VAALKTDKPLIFHFRVVKEDTSLEAKAGATVVFLPDLKRFGVSLCCSKDHYNKRWGRKIAEHRARAGDESRIKTKRFECAPSYDGPMEMDEIRRNAVRLVYKAAGVVRNFKVRDWIDANFNFVFKPLGQ